MPGPNVVSTSAITIHYNKPNQTVFFNTTLNIWNYTHQCFPSAECFDVYTPELA
jgi:hypothetical protein